MKRTLGFDPMLEAIDQHLGQMETYESNAILWATEAAARSRAYGAGSAVPADDDAYIRIRAVLEAMMMLADPSLRGSDEMLHAIIEERRKHMN
jgi:hypothetical protein